MQLVRAVCYLFRILYVLEVHYKLPKRVHGQVFVEDSHIVGCRKLKNILVKRQTRPWLRIECSAYKREKKKWGREKKQEDESGRSYQ